MRRTPTLLKHTFGSSPVLGPKACTISGAYVDASCFGINNKQRETPAEKASLRAYTRCGLCGLNLSRNRRRAPLLVPLRNCTGFCTDCLHPGLTGVYWPFRG